MSKTHSKTRTLVEGALMIALSTVLSMIQIPLMPHGGSITLLSMLPIILMSYRHGTRWGLLTAFLNSAIQLLQGIGNLAYCQTLSAQIGCVVWDYLLAFTVLGLAAQIGSFLPTLTAKAVSGTFSVCVLRYACSVLSGYIVWKDYDYAFEWLNNFAWGAWFTTNLGENALCWFYSFVYNATYMIPETIFTTLGVLLLCRTASALFAKQ